MYVCVLASGSKGNCIYVSSYHNKEAILVDAGLSWKRTKERADKKGVDLDNVKAIVVTHEHIDHYKGAAVVSKKLGDIPIYFNEEILELSLKNFEGKIQAFYKNLDIGDLTIEFFKTFHDSLAPIGMIITDKNKTNTTLGIATDLGTITPSIAELLRKSNLLLLESNYDEDMLWKGDYPEQLKMRIASDEGHLSNLDSAEFINSLDKNITKHVVLCHISQENNSRKAIKRTFSSIIRNMIPIHIASQAKGSSLFCI